LAGGSRPLAAGNKDGRQEAPLSSGGGGGRLAQLQPLAKPTDCLQPSAGLALARARDTLTGQVAGRNSSTLIGG